MEFLRRLRSIAIETYSEKLLSRPKNVRTYESNRYYLAIEERLVHTLLNKMKKIERTNFAFDSSCREHASELHRNESRIKM